MLWKQTWGNRNHQSKLITIGYSFLSKRNRKRLNWPKMKCKS